MENSLELAPKLAQRLGQIEGVAAVVLGGSWASGRADPNSDLDLGLNYSRQRPLEIRQLNQLAQELDDSHADGLVTALGGWGPWINGGGWLQIGGQRVDWIYRELEQVRQTIAECLAGKPACYYQPGHPLGFFSHIYLGEVYYCQPLYDPQNQLTELKNLLTPYPVLLKQALVEQYLWQAGFALETSQKSAARGESFYVSGNLFRAAACLVQVLFALNEKYLMNEKGSLKATANLALCPPNFEQRVEGVLGQVGTNPQQLKASLAEFEQLVAEVKKLAG